MTAKEYLQQIRKVDTLINCKLREIESLNELITSITTTSAGDRVQSSGADDKMGKTVAKIIDLQNETNDDVDYFVDLKRDIAKIVDELEPTYCELIHLRYFDYLTWEEIAVEMGYSFRQITRLHGQALLKLKDVLECPI